MSSTPVSRLTGLATAALIASVTAAGMPAASASSLPVSAPAVSAAPTVASAPSLAAAPTLTGSPSMSAFESRVLKKTNRARSQARWCGDVRMRAAKPLRWNAKLARAAHGHSADMATRNYFSHYSPEGTSPFTRIRNEGYDYRAAGENIAAGMSTPRAVVRAWLRSPNHCKVLMTRVYRHLGVGHVSGAGDYSVYWTQNFGRRR